MMKRLNKDQDTFLALLRAGLWEKDVELNQFDPIDFDFLYQIAEDQAVIGLLAAGLEHVTDMKITKPQAIPFLKKVVSLENRNDAMNAFIRDLMTILREKGVFAMLIKGQGIAQCYERPQWRSAGDIDLLLDRDNYERAKTIISRMSNNTIKEDINRFHFSIHIDSWDVELHGSLRCFLWSSFNRGLDLVQEETFRNSCSDVWINQSTEVFIPSIDSNVFFVFAHILQHLFREGIGLRQICDWVRLVWVNRDKIDVSLLDARLKQAGIKSEWMVFASLSVEYLGMPQGAIPLYDPSSRWKNKAKHVLSYVLAVGNFGRGRDNTYMERYPYFIYKIVSFFRHTHDSLRFVRIFPLDSIKAWWAMLANGICFAIQGK